MDDPLKTVQALPDFIRRRIEQAIHQSANPTGMSINDGKVRVLGADLAYMLALIDQMQRDAVQPAPEPGELHPQSALAYARQMKAYCEAFSDRDWASIALFGSVDEKNLATVLDNLTECAAMLMNMADRVATPQPAPEPQPAQPTQDERNLAAVRMLHLLKPGHGLPNDFRLVPRHPESQQDQLQRPDGHSTPCVEAASTAPLPDDLIRFLNGEAPLDGVWFGEKHPTERGAFWWRKHLPRVVEAQPGDQKQDDHAGSPAPSEPVARLLDHQIAGVVNHVTEIARKYHDTQQLRERIRGALGPLIAEVRYLRDAPSAESSKAALSDEEINTVVYELYRIAMYGDRGNSQRTMESIRAILARAGTARKPLTDHRCVDLIVDCGLYEPKEPLTLDEICNFIRTIEAEHGIEESSDEQ